MQLLTNSRMTCARECLRKHCLRYEYGLRPEASDMPLRIGSAFHAALESADAGLDVAEIVRAMSLDPYECEAVMRLYLAHEWRWGDSRYDPVATELAFELPLRNPETGAPTPLWNVAGKIDRVVRLGDGRLAIQEYKTTSSDLSPGSDYWVRLRYDQQISLYFIAARELGYDVSTVIYDVTYRPRLAPKQLPIIDDGAKVVLDAAGARVRTKDGKKWRETADTDLGYVLQTRIETIEEYGERLTNDIVARHEHYFARVEIPRLEVDVEEFRHELWQQQLALRTAQRTGHWFRNSSACVTPTRTCEYLHVCGRTDLATNTPEGFVRLDEIHPELCSPGASPATHATPRAIEATQ